MNIFSLIGYCAQEFPFGVFHVCLCSNTTDSEDDKLLLIESDNQPDVNLILGRRGRGGGAGRAGGPKTKPKTR